jgi:hypothetical protein
MGGGGFILVQQTVHDESAGKAAQVSCGVSCGHGLMHYESKEF